MRPPVYSSLLLLSLAACSPCLALLPSLLPFLFHPPSLPFLSVPMSRSQSSSNPIPTSVQVVTLTVTSSGSSTPTPSQSSSGGSSSVPIAAIAGGAAGGVTLAVLLVLIWKYWGLVIKRDQRKRRKEARDMLTVRENTRRNASSGFKPQSQYRPMLALNPDRRKVTFLTRGPTSPRKKQHQHGASPPAAPEEKHIQGEGEERAPALTPAPAAEEEIRQPSLGPLLPHGALLEAQDTDQGPPAEDDNAEPLTVAPTPAPTSPRIPATITPISAPVAPAAVRRVHTQWSSPAPSARSHTPPSGSSSTHGHAAPRMSSMPPPPRPPVSTVLPPPLPAGAAPPSPPSAGPSSPPLWSITAAPRSSVLPASPDRPVIMPRAKHASWAPPGASEEQPVSPASLRPHVPSLASSASQYSANSGEPSVRRGFLNALRHKPSAQAGGSANVRRTSTYSSASAYSND
ncbi:hypothetical protein EDB87DRAFT_1635467 [Lactarius vividus]|nr:hypothetical protein EDB87DRAFT_1635467 [Lactarius vividus]